MASHGVVKTNWYKIKAILAVVALLALAFAFACDNSGGPERDSITPVTKVVRVVEWPDGWPVPPLPVMSLEHESGVTQGSPHRYCWQLEDAADRVCKEYNIWSGVSHYPEVVPSERIPIIIDADTRPTKMFAQVYTRPGNLMVGGLRRLTTGAPWLDLADVGPGVYNVRLIGYWQDNEISYEFGLSVPGVVEMKGGCDMTLIDVAPVLTLESPDDRKRTAPDDANRAGCRFNKTIIRVSMTLHNDDLGSYTETFHVDPPSATVRFPLRDGVASEKTGEPLPPGEYSRRMVAITEDGEEWELAPGWFLEAVNVAER